MDKIINSRIEFEKLMKEKGYLTFWYYTGGHSLIYPMTDIYEKTELVVCSEINSVDGIYSHELDDSKVYDYYKNFKLQ